MQNPQVLNQWTLRKSNGKPRADPTKKLEHLKILLFVGVLEPIPRGYGGMTVFN